MDLFDNMDMYSNIISKSERAEIDRKSREHRAIIKTSENIEKTTQDVSILKDSVSGIDNRLALLNRRVDELSRDLEEARKKAEEAQKAADASAVKASKTDKRYNLLIALFSIVAAEGLTMLIAWLTQA